MRLLNIFSLKYGKPNSNNNSTDKISLEQFLLKEYDQTYLHYRHCENQRNIYIGILFSMTFALLPLSLKYIYNDYSFIFDIYYENEIYYSNKTGLYIKSIIPLAVVLVYNIGINLILRITIKLVKVCAFYSNLMDKIRRQLVGNVWFDKYHIAIFYKDDPVFHDKDFESKNKIEIYMMAISIILHIATIFYISFILWRFTDHLFTIVLNTMICIVEVYFVKKCYYSYWKIIKGFSYDDIVGFKEEK